MSAARRSSIRSYRKRILGCRQFCIRSALLAGRYKGSRYQVVMILQFRRVLEMFKVVVFGGSDVESGAVQRTHERDKSGI